MPDTPKRKTILKEVAIALIWPNPENPRSWDDPDAVKELAADMDAKGQRTPVKLVPLTDAEKSAIRAKKGPSYEYKLLGGHMRRKAALSLGWETLDALILDLTPEEAELEMIWDNNITQLPWLDRYKIIESQVNKNPGVFQEVIAKRVGVQQSDVSRALKTLKYLNQASREIVYVDYIRAGAGLEGGKMVTLAIIALEEPEKVEKALKVASKLKLTEQQAKSLVKWVKDGNTPETFSLQKAPHATKDKKASGLLPKTIDKVVELAEQVGIAKGRGEDSKPAQDKLNACLAEIKTKTLPAEVAHPIPSPEGFALWRQLLRKGFDGLRNLLKPQTEGTGAALEPANLSPGHELYTPHPAKKGKHKWMIHQLKKLGEKLVELPWKEFGKIEHQTARKLAHAIVPLRPSNRGHHNSGLGQQFATLFLTILHCMVYCLLQFGFWWFVLTGLASWVVPGLKPWVAWPFRFAAHLVIYDFLAWAWANFQSHLGPTLFIGAVLLIGLYYTCKAEPLRMSLLGIALAYLIAQGRGWAVPSTPWSEPVASATPSVSVPTPVIQPVRSSSPAGISSHSGTQEPASNSSLRTANSTPVASYQPAVSFAPPAAPEQTLYDAKLLEQVIAALPKNCVVKAFPVLTDEGMPGDLAVSRSQGVTDPDKYTLIIDGDKKIIVNIATTTTNLIINYKSADPLNIDGSGQLNHFWEDVLYIHTDAIYLGASVQSNHAAQLVASPQMYQLSLVVSGAKHAMTIQCASADDLKHLVSALQYFIRNSRLGHDTALAGMPYPYQGLVLNNDGVVDKLWADSLMDKAAVSLGDHFWSIGKVAFQRQSRTDLEAGLKTLPVTVFVASASEWDRALHARAPGSNAVRPRLRKVTLSSP